MFISFKINIHLKTLNFKSTLRFRIMILKFYKNYKTLKYYLAQILILQLGIISLKLSIKIYRKNHEI